MTGFTLQVRQFDNYLTNNYYNLRTTAQNICWNDPSYEDILNMNILKVRNRITLSGWTNTLYQTYDRSIFSYLWMSISNDFKLKKNREGKKTVYEFNDLSIQNDLLDYFNDLDHDSQQYYDNRDQFIRYLFQFIETKYEQKKATLFKTYYLTSANSYKKLAIQSGYTEKYIKEVIRTIKNDVKQNLLPYVKIESTVEVWRPVKNYEDLYFVSNKGRLKNQSGEIKLALYKKYYSLWKNNQRIYKSMEQMLAGTFKPNEVII